MPITIFRFVNSERLHFTVQWKQGREDGRKERKEGMKEGSKEGFKEARKEGRTAERKQGEGREEGRKADFVPVIGACKCGARRMAERAKDDRMAAWRSPAKRKSSRRSSTFTSTQSQGRMQSGCTRPPVLVWQRRLLFGGSERL